MSVDSKLLNPGEIQKVRDLLGQRVTSKSTAVIKFYTSNPGTGRWNFILTGVACVSKDSNRRTYFIQIFNIDQCKLEWEQEVYYEFSFKKDKSDAKIYTFEADNVMALMNFADENEAIDFESAITKRLQQTQERTVSTLKEQPKGISYIRLKNLKKNPDIFIHFFLDIF